MMNWLTSLITKGAAFLAAFFAGIQHEKKDNVEKENKRLKSSIGVSDSGLADKLRKRAANKRNRD
jgi:hypothetical protein